MIVLKKMVNSIIKRVKMQVKGNLKISRMVKNNVSEDEDLDEIDSINDIFNKVNVIKDNNISVNVKPILLNTTVENKPLTFAVDTGSPITAISRQFFERAIQFNNLQLLSTNRVFKS